MIFINTKVCRNQRGNQKPQIKEYIIQLQKEKGQTVFYITLHKKLKIEENESYYI